MNSTAIVDITSAVFLSVIFARRLADYRESKNIRQLNMCLLLIVLLINDALAYTLVGPKYPFWLRYSLNLITLFGIGFIFLACTFYAEMLFVEKMNLKPWTFLILKLVDVVWLILCAYSIIAQHIGVIPCEIDQISFSTPLYVDLLEYAIILTYPIFAFVNRKKIGNEIPILISIFVIGPFIASVLYLQMNIDYSYAITSLTFLLVDEFVLKRQATEQRLRNEKILEEARDAANAASEAKTNFLFNMSHDIRTPMNAIRGFTVMAKKNVGDEKKVTQYLDKIDISGQQLLALINQVLEMSRIESGKIEFNERVVDAREQFSSMTTVLAEQARTNGLKFHYSLKKLEHANVYADSTRLSSIALNLVGNAMKYTPKGGTIKFDLKEIPPRKQGYATFMFTVADTGIGMSKEYLEKIYEPFSREKNTTVSKIQGTGLGLAIVKSTIDLLGGKIDVQSELGKGTKFTVIVDLRIADDSVNDVVVTDDSAQLIVKGTKVLLVEDNEMNREIAKDILEEHELIVEEADDGYIAVNMVTEKGVDYYDVILMDIQMPLMNGYDATRAIRKLADGDKIPIIAVSANAFEEDKQKSLDAGMNAHIAKPIVVEELFNTMAKWI